MARFAAKEKYMDQRTSAEERARVIRGQPMFGCEFKSDRDLGKLLFLRPHLSYFLKRAREEVRPAAALHVLHDDRV